MTFRKFLVKTVHSLTAFAKSTISKKLNYLPCLCYFIIKSQFIFSFLYNIARSTTLLNIKTSRADMLKQDSKHYRY